MLMSKSNPTLLDITSQLRQKIVDRTIPPGTKLSDVSLSREWKVSRTPIREVLRRLESEGLVASYPYKGFLVNSITIEDIEQLYTIKIYLEGLAGRLATPIILKSPDSLKRLEVLCKEMVELAKRGDIESYIEKNNEFHYLMWNSCENKWLTRILENLNAQISRFIVRALHIPNRAKKSTREHWEIYKCLRTGDGAKVEKAIGTHFKNSLNDIRRELVKQP